jgi:hypothetical protein
VALPMLRDQFNTNVDASLCRLAEHAKELEECLSILADRLLKSCLLDQQPSNCRVDVSPLKSVPKYLACEVFRKLWIEMQFPRQAMTYEHWSRLCEILETGDTITLPDRIEARFHGETLLVIRSLK